MFTFLILQKARLVHKQEHQFLYAVSTPDQDPGLPPPPLVITSSRKQLNPHQPHARNTNLTLTMNRQTRYRLFHVNQNGTIPQPAMIMQSAIAYFTPPTPYTNNQIPFIFWGWGNFPWAKGHGAVPTKTLARETAIAGAVVVFTPETGTSQRCISTSHLQGALANAPDREFHRTTKAVERQSRCQHK